MAKTLIITQCCKKKRPVELFNISVSILDFLDKTKYILIEGRKKFKQYIYGIKEVTALSLYNGLLYSFINKKLVYEEFIKNRVDFVIISAAYGVVHAFERIKEYELEMDKNIAKQWLKLGLHKVLKEYIIKTEAKEVYGFFTKSSLYSTIFMNMNLNNATHHVLKCILIYPENCKGGSNSLRELGYTIMYFIKYRTLPKETKYCKRIVERNIL